MSKTLNQKDLVRKIRGEIYTRFKNINQFSKSSRLKLTREALYQQIGLRGGKLAQNRAPSKKLLKHFGYEKEIRYRKTT